MHICIPHNIPILYAVGTKITVNLNAILMMAIVVVLIWMLLNNGEQAEAKKVKTHGDKKNN